MNSYYLKFKTMKTIKLFAIAILATLTFTACSDDDDPIAVNPEEVITDFSVIFTNVSDATDRVTLTAVSADGIVAPTLNVDGTFASGATYDATLTIVDNVNGENILEEVIEEAEEHFFVYSVNGVALSMVRADNDVQDSNGISIGVFTNWTANAPGTGTLTVQLVHEPGSVVDDGSFGSATGGEFDVNNTWNVEIQ